MDDSTKFGEVEADVHSDANGNPVNPVASTTDKDDKNGKAVSRIGLGTARRPPDRTWKEKVKKFFYNPEEGSFLGRTPLSWVLITVFFICFYAIVAGLWLGCWFVFLQTMSWEEPKYTGASGLISDNPGVGIKPGHEYEKLKQHANVRPSFRLINETVMLEGETKPDGENKRCVDEIEKLFEKFKKPVGASYNHSFNPLKSLGECATPFYGYTKSVEPCYYLTLNKIWNWTFTPIKLEDFDKRGWPTELKSRFQKATDKNQIFFHCDEHKSSKKGSNATEASKVRFKYFPVDGGIPRKFFPYVGSDDSNLYHQPMVAVKIELPPREKGKERTIVTHVIECKAYYDKVVHSSQLGRLQGLIQFEIEVFKKRK